jgi:hypothetical protein
MNPRVFFLFLCAASWIAASEQSQAKELSVASLNIRFYGRELDASQQTEGSDSRDSYLADYIEENLASADVIAFEEIVKEEDFINNVLKNRWTCQGYENSNRGHQHVLICYKKEYKFIPPNFDSDFIIQEATLGRKIRPIVHGILTDLNGKHLAYIAAVHLKANADQSELRMQQIQVLADKMQDLEPRLPAIVVGDFNTSGNDVEDFTEVFQKAGLRRRIGYNPKDATIKTPDFQGKFDHFWVNTAASVSQTVTTSQICLNGSERQLEYDSIEEYNQRISDHCYIKSSFLIGD